MHFMSFRAALPNLFSVAAEIEKRLQTTFALVAIILFLHDFASLNPLFSNLVCNPADKKSHKFQNFYIFLSFS